MSFKLVVWDFDGTLADSLPTAVGIFNRLAPEMGFRPVEDLAAGLSVGRRLHEPRSEDGKPARDEERPHQSSTQPFAAKSLALPDSNTCA